MKNRPIVHEQKLCMGKSEIYVSFLEKGVAIGHKDGLSIRVNKLKALLLYQYKKFTMRYGCKHLIIVRRLKKKRQFGISNE